ncbi:MAG: GNAT family N-acetyltransferase [Massilibacteroides sp.]|nr:GNAT family N-acetyltransferase [Massilibacteroides sp.]MDD3063368.1 GNAT family N-acetyltransferase [Massilibacteroides sp.]MDD4114355.1 GNAT family N-acetyltransferase [Massilibacteroides sp.]MDD4659688.1 GNAT family N-acetyltransferase [Massilibacteroides sp.]
MEEVQFRIACREDLSKIVEIYNSTVPLRTVTADTEPVSVQSRQAWFDAHVPDKYPLWVMENIAGEIWGWMSFQPFYGRPAYAATVEVSIYLDESCRGKGWGRRALRYCIEQAPKYGIKNLLGFIFEHNVPSLRLFESLGFSIWGKLPRIAVLDGREYGLDILGKKVTVPE